MFYLKGRGSGDGKYNETEDDFGWWLSDDIRPTRVPKDCRSSGSSSMLSCVDSDDSETYALAQDFKQESHDDCERIELTTLIHQDLDVDLIEQDAANKDTVIAPFAGGAGEIFDKSESKSQRSLGMCYTPERLVRSQEYRILTPSPRYLSVSQSRVTPENENPQKAFRCRRRLNYLVDGKQIGTTQLKTLLDSPPEILVPHWRKSHKLASKRIDTETAEDALNLTEKLQDSMKSYERLSWEDCKRTSSLEDTSGIQSNDWSSDTHSDVQNTLCLCDELAIASAEYRVEFSQERNSAINEVVSILEVLETDPDKATVLLEEDRFCDSASSHDQLTRLALAIEPDGQVPGVRENPDHLVQHLQRKIEKLQTSSKDIYRDIRNLRKSFQVPAFGKVDQFRIGAKKFTSENCDEQRMADISLGATKLREDVHEMRYLDDLLNLLRGELERISRRNWPFVIGHTEHHSEELNLIV